MHVYQHLFYFNYCFYSTISLLKYKQMLRPTRNARKKNIKMYGARWPIKFNVSLPEMPKRQNRCFTMSDTVALSLSVGERIYCCSCLTTVRHVVCIVFRSLPFSERGRAHSLSQRARSPLALLGLMVVCIVVALVVVWCWEPRYLYEHSN